MNKRQRKGKERKGKKKTKGQEKRERVREKSEWNKRAAATCSAYKYYVLCWECLIENLQREKIK